jgi:RNA polymerase sigma factor (sigma-70 family)
LIWCVTEAGSSDIHLYSCWERAKCYTFARKFWNPDNLDVNGRRSNSSTGWLYEQHSGTLTALVARRFRLPLEDAEDVVQQSFLAFLTQKDRIEAPVRWLMRVAFNLAAGRIRERDRVVTNQPGDTFSGAVVHPDVRVLVQTLLQSRTRRRRTILELRYFWGLSSSEIGCALSMTPGHVRQELRRALCELREQLSCSRARAVAAMNAPECRSPSLRHIL